MKASSKEMGVDAGFDFYPPLKEEEMPRWSDMLNRLQQIPQVQKHLKVTQSHLIFELGEVPTIPKNGVYFRRFSSRTDGYVCNFLYLVYQHFKEWFSDRVHWWDEAAYDESDILCQGIYSWEQVYEIQKDYQTLDEVVSE